MRDGRPTKYRPEYCEKIIEFFDRKLVEIEMIPYTDKNGNEKVKEIMRPCRLPTFERFAFEVGVCRDTLLTWCDQYEDFFCAYKKAKDLQKEILMQNTLSNLYNAPFAIFSAKNITDMRDTKNVDNTSSDGSMTPTTIVNNDLSHLSDEDLEKIKNMLKKPSEDTNT